MDKTTSKIVTVCFVLFSAIIGFTLQKLIIISASISSVMARAADTDIVRHLLPAAVGIGLFFYLQFNKQILEWANEVVSEIRKVVWPTGKDTSVSTVVVLVMCLISSLIVLLFDFLSGGGITQVVSFLAKS